MSSITEMNVVYTDKYPLEKASEYVSLKSKCELTAYLQTQTKNFTLAITLKTQNDTGTSVIDVTFLHEVRHKMISEFFLSLTNCVRNYLTMTQFYWLMSM